MNVTLASLGLAASGWAWSLAAVGLPIAAHLWSRRTGPPARFPTLRLIERADRQRPRHRLADLLLLALRCAAVAAVALAFAQPIWRTQHTVAASPVAGVTAGDRVVVIIDASASMTRQAAGRSLFDAALDRSERLVGQAAARGAKTWVMLAAHEAQPVVRRPIDATWFAAHRARWQPLATGLDLAAALREADALAGGGTRLVFVTDEQGAAQAQAIVTRSGMAGGLVIERLDATAPSANLALTEAAIRPARPAVGQSAIVSVLATNHGRDAAEAAVSLHGVAGGSVTRVQLAPGQGQRVRFAVTFDRAGQHRLDLRLAGDDGLSLDDDLPLLVGVRQNVDVAMLTLDDGQAGDANDAAAAVARLIEPGAQLPYRVRRVTAEELVDRGATVPELLVVVASRPTSLHGRALGGTIASHVRRGMGLVVLGPLQIDPTMDVFAGHPPLGGSWTLDPVDPRSPPWRVFDGGSLATLLDVRFAAAFAGRVADGARPVAMWRRATAEGDPAEAADAPAMARRRFGLGAVVAVSARLSPEVTTLYASPAGVGLMAELLQLVHDDVALSRAATAGELVTITLPPMSAERAATLQMRSPAGESASITIALRDDRTLVRAGPLASPGLYRVIDGEGRTLAAVTAMLPPSESDLTGQTPVDAPRLGVTQTGPSGNASADATPVGQSANRPSPAMTTRTHVLALWPLCLALAGVLLVAEMLTSSRLSVTDPGRALAKTAPASAAGGVT